MSLNVSKENNAISFKWLTEKVASLDARNATAYAFTCGEIHAAYMMNVITREQYETLEQAVDAKFYEVHIN